MELQTTNKIALREPMKLTSENVEAIFKDCLAESDEKIRQIISGVRIKAGFNRDKVTANRDNILSMLSCLPKEFHAFKGGGWTFLNLCVDADGRQWTDFHQMCDMLVCLGIVYQNAKRGNGISNPIIKARNWERVATLELVFGIETFKQYYK